MIMINKILHIQILSTIFILIDIIHPKFLNNCIIPNMFEYLVFIILLGSSIGLIIKRNGKE